MLERHDLAEGLLAEITRHLAAHGVRLQPGTFVGAPASTKNRARQRDPEMHQVNKGNQWYFGMKVHNGVDAVAGLLHLVATAANVADITRVPQLLRGGETPVWGDRLVDRSAAAGATAAQAERRKASIRAKVEHPFL